MDMRKIDGGGKNGLDTWSKSLRYGGCPRIVLGDQVCGCPDLGVEVDTDCVDFDKFEGVLVDLDMLLVRVVDLGGDNYHVIPSNSFRHN